nr:hypothetical protein [Tanacetum cinerariifolium]
TLKDLLGIIHGTIHLKAIDERGYGKDIIVESALKLANVSVFSLKPSMLYLNITIRNVVKVFHNDLVLGLLECYYQEMTDEKALNLALDEEARQARADQEWLEKC